ncbi:MAG: hypothetical protein ABWY22_06775, partial [Flavobacterium sp.]
MCYKLKLFFAFLLVLSSQCFYAQQITTTSKAQIALEKKAEKSSDDYHKKLNDEHAKLKQNQDKLKKEQKTVEKHQKDLKNSEKDL